MTPQRNPISSHPIPSHPSSIHLIPFFPPDSNFQHHSLHFSPTLPHCRWLTLAYLVFNTQPPHPSSSLFCLHLTCQFPAINRHSHFSSHSQVIKPNLIASYSSSSTRLFPSPQGCMLNGKERQSKNIVW